MNLDKYSIKYMYFVMVITFITSLLVISSTTDLSFAKIDNDNKVDDRESKKHTSISTINKDKEKTLDDNLKEPNEQKITLSPRYPDQFFVCGYPQQIITDYNTFEKINCKR